MSTSIDAYRSIKNTTVSPRALILRAFDAAIESLVETQAALAAGRAPHEPLERAHTLVSGLIAALNVEAGDLAKKLLQLYLFVMECIHETRASGKDKKLDEAKRVLESLRAGWASMPYDPELAAPPTNVRNPGIQVRG